MRFRGRSKSEIDVGNEMESGFLVGDSRLVEIAL